MIPAHDTEFVKRIPELIKLLGGIKTVYSNDDRYIGEAITYLRLLHGLAISDSSDSDDSGCPCGSGKCGLCE